MRHAYRCTYTFLFLLLWAHQPIRAQQPQAATTPVLDSPGQNPGTPREQPQSPAVDKCSSIDNSGTVLTLDFSKKQFRGEQLLNSLQQGNFYRLRIENINPALYKISLGVRDTSSSKALAVPSFGTLGLTDLLGLVATLTPLGNLTTAPVLNAKNFGLSLDDIEQVTSDRLEKSIDKPQFQEILKGRYTDLPRSSEPEQAKILIEAYQLTLKQQAAELEKEKNELDNLLFSYNKYLIYAKADVGFNTGMPTADNHTLESLFNGFQSQRIRVEQLETKVDTAFENYTATAKRYNTVIQADEKLKAANEKVKTVNQELASSVDKIKESVSAENSLKYVESIVAVLNNSCTTYMSLPIQFSKEQAKLKIFIEPRKPEYMLHSYSTELLYPIDKLWFWGVSSGLYVGKLHNEAYSSRSYIDTPQDTVVKYTLVQEKVDKVEFGVNAMVRAGRMFTEDGWLGGHVGFGPGLAVSDKVRPRLMIGGGLVLGRSHKFLLDFGVACGYVDRLSKAYEVSGPFYAKPEKTTVSQFSSGKYFSLHYIFFQP